jgi:hypothetical protein
MNDDHQRPQLDEQARHDAHSPQPAPRQALSRCTAMSGWLPRRLLSAGESIMQYIIVVRAGAHRGSREDSPADPAAGVRVRARVRARLIEHTHRAAPTSSTHAEHPHRVSASRRQAIAGRLPIVASRPGARARVCVAKTAKQGRLLCPSAPNQPTGTHLLTSAFVARPVSCRLI